MVRTYLPSVCPQMPSPANPIVVAASASATRFSRALGLSANWVSLYFFIFMESLTAPYYIPFPAASGAIKGRGGSAAEARAVGGGAFNVSSRWVSFEFFVLIIVSYVYLITALLSFPPSFVPSLLSSEVFGGGSGGWRPLVVERRWW